MPASTTPPVSRHRITRIADLDHRLAIMSLELDALSDRRAPLAPRLAQRGWRVVDEVRRALRMAPIPPAQRGRSPFDLAWEMLSVSRLLTPSKALGIKATPRAAKKSYPRASGRR